VLDAPPSIYRGGGAPGAIMSNLDGNDAATVPSQTPPTVSAGFTTEVARTRPLSEVLGQRRVDPEILAEAATIASQLALRPRRAHDRKRGRTRTSSVRFDGGADELDLDRTIELLSEGRPLASTELYVRRPLRSRRSVALLADVSGSMDGAKARICAAAIGALAGELIDDELTVIAFWKDVAVLRVRASHLDPVELLDELLRIEPGGLTNVHGAIELAALELSRSSLERRAIVLLSDCVHNAGPDPRSMARRAPTTHVLLEQTGEHDAWLGERIARAGGGRCRAVADLAEVAPALSFLLAD
jgi:Mg-chelatase subunit ChlD